MSTPTPARADVAVIGGSGLYRFLTDAHEVAVDTPFGPPSDPVTLGRVEGRAVAFLPRHGRDHRLPPHRIDYRANLWALRSLGVRQVLAPCAVGSLDADLGPGTVVVPDQVLDRTWGRRHTVYDEPGPVVHVPFADPFCPRGRAAVLAADRTGLRVVDGGTSVVVNGPRFSSRAESRWHAAAGGTVVGMTTMPEAAVARELAMCFTSVALVTDLDAGVEGGEHVTHAEVIATFATHVEALRGLLTSAVAGLPGPEPDESAGCACRRVLDGIRLPFELPA